MPPARAARRPGPHWIPMTTHPVAHPVAHPGGPGPAQPAARPAVGLPEQIRRAAEAARGFMPPDEGQALFGTAAAYSRVGPVAEIGTYCGKSTIYLAAAVRDAGQRVVTV